MLGSVCGTRHRGTGRLRTAVGWGGRVMPSRWFESEPETPTCTPSRPPTTFVTEAGDVNGGGDRRSGGGVEAAAHPSGPSGRSTKMAIRGPASSSSQGQAGVCLKGRALWGQTQGGYNAVGARCKIGWGAVTGGWSRVGVALGLRTCLGVELKEEPWGGGGGGSLQAKPWGQGNASQASAPTAGGCRG